MKIFWLTIFLIITRALATANQPTIFAYYYEHQNQQEQDFIQITLKIQSHSKSLSSAISDATNTIAEVKSLALQYCRENKNKEKKDCKEAVEVQRMEIESKYQKVRKEDTFQNFIVSHEVAVNVYSPDRIGSLVDSFLKLQEVTLEGFDWVPFEQTDPQEAAIKGGLQLGGDLCQQIGMQLGRTVDIQQINEPSVAEQQEQDQQGQQQSQDPIVYRFEVECIKKVKKEKKPK